MKKIIGERKSFNYSELPSKDKGIKVSKALELVKDSPYSKDIYKSMKIEEIKSDFIAIEGAENLVNMVLSMDKKFIKFDIQSELKDVKCEGLLDKKSAFLEISNIQNEDVLKITKKDIIKGVTKYAVKSDYLDKIYQADKYLNYCYDNDYISLITKNLEFLEDENSNNLLKKQFRILKDSETYYIRAITSIDSYKDYNIKFSIFVALIALHRIIKSNKDEYNVRYCSSSESDVRVVFRRKSNKEIAKGLKVGFELELVNDEIKREAVKFNGLFSISYGDGKVLSIKPDINATIIRFSHRLNVEKVSRLIKGLPEAIDSFIETMYKDIILIKKSESPKELKKHLSLKIKRAQQKEFREKYRKEIQGILEKENVNTFFQLLDLMNKIDLLIDDSDIKAKDYWKLKLYEVLIKNKN